MKQSLLPDTINMLLSFPNYKWNIRCGWAAITLEVVVGNFLTAKYNSPLIQGDGHNTDVCGINLGGGI